MQTTLLKHRISLTLLAGLALTGCGGGGGGGGAPATTFTASSYFTKTTVGNTWNSIGTTTLSGLTNSSTTTSHLFKITASAGGVTTDTLTVTDGGVAATPVTRTRTIDGNGNLTTTTGSIVFINLPATFSAGSIWEVAPATATKTTTTGKIVGVGVSCSSNSQTFNDCIHVQYTYTGTGTGTTGGVAYTYAAPITTSIYFSPSVGWEGDVQNTTSYTATFTFTGGLVLTSTYSQTMQLQSGYIAN